MYSRCRLLVAAAMTPVLAGCSISGTWKTIRVEPAEFQEKFSIQTVTFGDDGMYTSSAEYNGQRATSIGTYEWSGTKLTIKPRDGEARVYSGHQQLDGKLVLSHEFEGSEVTATLQKK